MCGRFALSATTDQVEKLLPELYSNRKIIPNYNIAPSQEVAVILNTKPKEINFAVWGLIPSWAKDEKIGQKMINARSETLMEKPSFNNLFIRKRCLIIADGFYEWKKDEKTKSKTPYFIKMKTGEPLTFAGLWDEWIDKSNNDKVISTTIITTEPNELMLNIHNRMPAIILPNERNLWLSPEVQTNHLKSLFIPIPGELLEAYPVSGRVNSPMNIDSSSIEEL